jgi:hypothetical protein
MYKSTVSAFIQARSLFDFKNHYIRVLNQIPIIIQNYCGLDVHKDSVFMCILNESGVLKEQQFKTLSSDLHKLKDELTLYDVNAHWIGLVLMKGLVSGSYVPDQKIQALRQYERRYSALNKRVVHVEQCIDMQLHRCNIRFSNYISDTGSQAMRKVVKSIINGITMSGELLKCAHCGMIREEKFKSVSYPQIFTLFEVIKHK